MNLERILAIVARKVQDASYGNAEYIDFINLCLGEIASDPITALPRLKVFDTVTVEAGSYEAYLPDDLYSGPTLAYNLTTKEPVKVWPNLTEFQLKYPHLGESGNVEHICNAGSSFLVHYTPAADQVINIWYVQEFEDVEDSDDDDALIILPKHLRGPLLINFCCMKAFEEIEDGVGSRGATPNYDKHLDLYMRARADLRTFLGVPDGVPDFVETVNPPSDLTDEI
jgi:hypothetical protein